MIYVILIERQKRHVSLNEIFEALHFIRLMIRCYVELLVKGYAIWWCHFTCNSKHTHLWKMAMHWSRAAENYSMCFSVCRFVNFDAFWIWIWRNSLNGKKLSINIHMNKDCKRTWHKCPPQIRAQLSLLMDEVTIFRNWKTGEEKTVNRMLHLIYATRLLLAFTNKHCMPKCVPLCVYWTCVSFSPFWFLTPNHKNAGRALHTLPAFSRFHFPTEKAACTSDRPWFACVVFVLFSFSPIWWF